MSNYLEMWEAISDLSDTQCREWYRALSPARGVEINFRGVEVIDTDLLEALDYAQKENRRARQPWIYKEMDGTIIVRWNTRDGNVPPYPVLVPPAFLIELIEAHNKNLKH